MLRDSLLTGFKVWGVRRVQTRTVAAVAGALVVIGFLGVWSPWAGVLAAGAGVAALIVLRHRAIPPEKPAMTGGDGWAFAGERIAYRSVSEVLDRKPREVAERLAARYSPGFQVEMILWVVATDGMGQPWTIVQDRYGDAVPSFTASAVGTVPGACDPYLEAQRLSLAETGLALADVMVVGWGVDTSLDIRRDVIIVIGQASVGVEKLASHTYDGEGRRSHLVELHPDSVARSLGGVDARRWQAGAVRGMVRCLDVLYPGSGPLLEELVTEPWRNRRMFSRLGRLTGELDHRAPGHEPTGPAPFVDVPGLEDPDETTDAGPLVRDPVVLKVIDGGLSEETEVRPPIPHRRALSWEPTARAVPTRYR